MSTVSSLAIDIGGSFVKAARIANGEISGDVARVPTPDFLRRSEECAVGSGARELDAQELDATVRRAIRQLELIDDSFDQILVTGQMAGLAFVDKRGNAVAPLISWQDRRYTNVEAVEGRLGSQELARLGDGLRTGSPLVTLATHHRPEGSFVTSLIAYVAGKLAGTRALTIHATDAASWGMLDVHAYRWSEASCALVGLSQADLPRVTRSMDTVAPSSVVRVAVGDQQAALLGAGLGPGMVSINLATGCQVSRIDTAVSSQVQTRPYFDGLYLHTVTHLPAGRLLREALLESRGGDSVEDWAWLKDNGLQHPGVLGAGKQIADAIAEAVSKLSAGSQPVLLSGGLLQRVGWLRGLILNVLGHPPCTMFDGDDAAISGLCRLSQYASV